MKFRHLAIIGLCLFALMLLSCQSPSLERFGEDSLVCFKAEGAGMFSFFSGYADTRVVHIPKALQATMGIDNLESLAEKCWMDGNSLQMIEALRLIDSGQATNSPTL